MTDMAIGYSWVQEMHSQLNRESSLGVKALDLFCGAGGLSLGFWACGFDVHGIDRNEDAVGTYAFNLGQADCLDARNLTTLPDAAVIVAGPPCQPWSRAGKRLGALDDRDGLAVIMQVAQRKRPLALVIENVPDLARPHRREYVDTFKSQLRELDYAVSEHILNAAHYGVPQNRRRLFVTAVLGRNAMDAPPSRPGTVSVQEAIPETCQYDALGTQMLTDGMNAYIKRYERASGCRTPRDLHLDRPSRTLTVRNLNGATGDMVRLLLPDGRRRTLTVSEAARLQSFPSWFQFQGADRSCFEQIGNAVPPLLSLAVAKSIRARLIPNAY